MEPAKIPVPFLFLFAGFEKHRKMLPGLAVQCNATDKLVLFRFF
jgi:hypothetical protein